MDIHSVIENLVDKIKDKNLLPKPHLGAINSKSKSAPSPGLFTSSDKPSSPNAIGYDYLVHTSSSSSSLNTHFEFFVRSGIILDEEDKSKKCFEKIVVDIIMPTSEKNPKISFNFESKEKIEAEMTQVKKVENKNFFEYEYFDDFPIRFYDTENGNINQDKSNKIRILFKKNIEFLEDGKNKVQLQIKNLTEQSQIQLYVPRQDKFLKNSADMGLLLNYSIEESCKNAKFSSRPNRGINTSILRLLNVIAQKENEDKIIFQDYYIGKEIVPKFKMGKKVLEFINDLKSESNLDSSIANVFEKIWGKEAKFYKYQEEGIKNILEEIKNKTGKVNIISVRTAGGKTETFSVPLIDYCLKNLDKKYTKALIFYPTKALANDQASRIFRILYYLNKNSKNRAVTMGIYHGDIKGSSTDERIVWLPWKCPECDEPVSEKKEGINHYLNCKQCNILFDFVYLTKYQVHQNTPDILITNQDTLNYRLMESPESHSILGRETLYCNKCGEAYIKGKNCPKCNISLEKISPKGVPEIIVFDEVHLLKGAFGMNTSLFLKRLETVLKIYSKNEKYRPVYIGASATIKKPEVFAKKLFHGREINIIPKEDYSEIYEEENEQNLKREHLFILPTIFSSSETTAFGVSFILDQFKKEGQKPHILGFNNSLKDCRDLIARTQARALKSRINGHTSQFDTEMRAETEMSFSKGDIDVLYATSTLEVGVDFDDIDVLIIHGAPPSFNDFLQRVGRSGRKKDSCVITSLKSWSPIDYFYFENCKALLENPDEYKESPPINERNITLIENHLKCIFFDFLTANEKTSKFSSLNELKNYLTNGSTQNKIEASVKSEIKKFALMSFPNEEKAFDEKINEIENALFGSTTINMQYINEFLSYLKDREQIHQLRTSDKQVEVEYII
jgi:ATP-dependent helicase YprA (DUF1998 family)